MRDPKDKKDISPEDDDFFKPDPIYIPERKRNDDFQKGMEENLPDLGSLPSEDDYGGLDESSSTGSEE